MLERATKLGCALRPHVKTCKTAEAGVIATGGTRRRIAVSTLAEAQFFAEAGFEDILYAVPLVPDAGRLQQAAQLTEQLQSFHVMVDNSQQVQALTTFEMLKGRKRFSVFVCIDCGYGRDGVDTNDPSSVQLIRSIVDSTTCTFAGLYTHGGHSYDCSGREEVETVATAERDASLEFAEALRAKGLKVPCVGVGSTPTCSHPPAEMHGIDEMHPGNYLYYDAMQASIGSCRADDIAVRVLMRVVGHYPRSNTLVVDCGWTGCSMQGKEHNFGLLSTVDGSPAPPLKILGFSQEVGRVTSVDGSPLDFGRHPIGSLLQLKPWHSCAATHQHREVHVVDGPALTSESKIIDTWRICKGW